MSGLDGPLVLDLEVAAIQNDWTLHGAVVDRPDGSPLSGVALIYRNARRSWGVVRWHRHDAGDVTFSSGLYDLNRVAAVADFRARTH